MTSVRGKEKKKEKRKKKKKTPDETWKTGQIPWGMQKLFSFLRLNEDLPLGRMNIYIFHLYLIRLTPNSERGSDPALQLSVPPIFLKCSLVIRFLHFI